MENVRIRDGFHEFAGAHEPLVVSSGFHELIEPVLEREGLELEVVANRVDARPTGWHARFRNDEPCAVCGQPCKRADVAGAETSSTPATASPIAASRSRRRASSLVTGWPTT